MVSRYIKRSDERRAVMSNLKKIAKMADAIYKKSHKVDDMFERFVTERNEMMHDFAALSDAIDNFVYDE